MKRFLYTFTILLAVVLYAFTIRGNFGNPTPTQIEYELYNSGQPFETSQERSRWALLLSVVNYKTVNIDNFASMGTPDVGRINGHYYSFFPPGATFFVLPAFLLGSALNMSQIFTFSTITLFALLTMLLIVRFTQKIGLHWSVSLFSALAFGFATNAWGYSVTFYAHIISGFMILSGLYVTLFWEKYPWAKGALVWLLYAIAVFLDFPNLFIFFPIVAILTLRGFSVEQLKEKVKLHINWAYVFTPLLFISLMLGYGYYNYVNFGSPTILSNAIPRVKDLKTQPNNVVSTASIPESTKNAGQSLQTRNMLEGFHSFTISSDRGILIYSPIAVLFLFGIGFLKRQKKIIEVGLITIPATCLVLYTMFGDPYGGWAFGSRYMLAILPELCILAGLGLARFYNSITVKLIYTVVFIYSAAISLMAPLTTNVIPPLVEARGLGLQASYAINWGMLMKNELDSLLYKNVFSHIMSGLVYYFMILTIVILSGLTMIWWKKGAYETISK